MTMLAPRQIWKFPLLEPDNALALPLGAVVLAVQLQDGKPVLWALCRPGVPIPQSRVFRIYGTGWNLPEDAGQYVATYQQGDLVWHVFEAAA